MWHGPRLRGAGAAASASTLRWDEPGHRVDRHAGAGRRRRRLAVVDGGAAIGIERAIRPNRHDRAGRAARGRPLRRGPTDGRGGADLREHGRRVGPSQPGHAAAVAALASRRRCGRRRVDRPRRSRRPHVRGRRHGGGRLVAWHRLLRAARPHRHQRSRRRRCLGRHRADARRQRPSARGSSAPSPTSTSRCCAPPHPRPPCCRSARSPPCAPVRK